jgi:hypothetical protein
MSPCSSVTQISGSCRTVSFIAICGGPDFLSSLDLLREPVGLPRKGVLDSLGDGEKYPSSTKSSFSLSLVLHRR